MLIRSLTRRRTGRSGQPQVRVRRSRLRSAITAALVTGLTVLVPLPTPVSAGETRQARQVAYVTNLNGNTVSVIDVAGNTTIATIPVGLGPTGVAASPGGTRVFVVNQGSRTVSVIDTATNGVIATIPVGVTPFNVAITPGGTRAYVTNLGSDNVSVIDTATNTVIATIPVGNGPIGVKVSPGGHPRLRHQPA
ncbi:hypothetical protein TBS_18880 [Thermobispora bispora]|uniref:40-residue YVTN family beta-propeller repeat protein n=1 Tax=Thermobispora bispora (strain ATCC 19993 / DSM 43833 / CBS 139.67 / JCM 10125 / KCTC 9307 / NBRC 14880 / R51) TaxID=469371 RepID=D6Y2A4_THEBD|nr:YVTN family beta-propeller repeat-containing protein [Thermobispora bispora]ADG86839.1 40-residue YVTN family beta-propeller repeat protein [Thermobispora bispora DSM 43833]